MKRLSVIAFLGLALILSASCARYGPALGTRTPVVSGQVDTRATVQKNTVPGYSNYSTGWKNGWKKK